MHLLKYSKHTIFWSKLHSKKINLVLKGIKLYDTYFVWRSYEKM